VCRTLVGTAAALFAQCALVALSLGEGAGAGEVRTPKKADIPAPLKELKPGFVAVDISGFFNNDAFSDEADWTDSDFDLWRQSFPADEVPPAGPFEPKGTGTLFLFPNKEKGKKNNVACGGQRIPLSGRAKELHFLVTATDYEQEEKLTIQYAEGEAKVDFKVSDWCQQAQFGEKAGVECAHRVAVDSEGKNVLSKEKRTIRIWVVAVPLDGQRELKTLVLPRNLEVHVFALTLAR